MTAFALITGALFRVPEQKTAKSGKPFVTATVKVAADNSSDFWTILAFSESAQVELMRLREGDKISAQGTFKLETYQTREGETRIGRTLFADHVVALRQPPRERKTKASAPGAPPDAAPSSERGHDHDDEIPF